MIYSILFYISLISAFVYVFISKRKGKAIDSKGVIKILSIILFVSLMVKAFAADGFTAVINGGLVYDYENYVEKTDIPETIIRWGFLVSECFVFSLSVSDNRRAKWIISYITLPLLMVASIYFPISIRYFSEPIEYTGYYLCPRQLASILTIMEYVSLFTIAFIVHLFEKPRIEGKKEKRQTVKMGVICSLICIPFLSYASVFGTTSIEIQVFNIYHILWILSVPIVYLTIRWCFIKEDEEIRFTVLSVVVFFLVIHFTNCYKIGYRTNRLPFQLCNIAAYFFLYILLKKNQKLLNFLLIANPTGAIIAMIATDTGNIFNFWLIHYLVEHMYVFIIPLLFSDFGYLKKPGFGIIVKDYFKYFTIYYFFCLFFNAINNGAIWEFFRDEYINDTNFFFLVECPIADYVPFYPYLECLEINLFGQGYYIGYLIFVYAVFTLLSFAFYFVPVLIRMPLGLIKRNSGIEPAGNQEVEVQASTNE